VRRRAYEFIYRVRNMKITLKNGIQAVVICGVILATFVCLNTKDISPGWVSPSKIYESGDIESLLSHNGELWNVYTRGAYNEEEILISHSKDGIKWSPPHIFLKELPKDSIFFGNPRWLKRPDGHIWLLWYSGTRDPDDNTETLHYAELLDNGTWSIPHEIHRYNGENYFFWSIANTLEGGLVIMMDYWPPGYATIQGREVPALVFTECIVQKADESLKWNPPISLSQTHFADSSDIYLDNEGIIWAIYEESDPAEGVYSRLSEDGISWSEPHQIIKGSVYATTFFQRSNGEYVLFFIGDTHAVYMVRSSDGQEWSEPSSVFSMNDASGLDAVESDDGTIWALVDCEGAFYLTQYSGQRYQEDLQSMWGFRIKNGALTCGVVFIVYAVWLSFEKKRRNE
jgi:hypothetical protein